MSSYGSSVHREQNVVKTKNETEFETNHESSMREIYASESLIASSLTEALRDLDMSSAWITLILLIELGWSERVGRGDGSPIPDGVAFEFSNVVMRRYDEALDEGMMGQRERDLIRDMLPDVEMYEAISTFNRIRASLRSSFIGKMESRGFIWWYYCWVNTRSNVVMAMRGLIPLTPVTFELCNMRTSIKAGALISKSLRNKRSVNDAVLWNTRDVCDWPSWTRASNNKSIGWSMRRLKEAIVRFTGAHQQNRLNQSIITGVKWQSVVPLKGFNIPFNPHQLVPGTSFHLYKKDLINWSRYSNREYVQLVYRTVFKTLRYSIPELVLEANLDRYELINLLTTDFDVAFNSVNKMDKRHLLSLVSLKMESMYSTSPYYSMLPFNDYNIMRDDMTFWLHGVYAGTSFLFTTVGDGVVARVRADKMNILPLIERFVVALDDETVERDTSIVSEIVASLGIEDQMRRVAEPSDEYSKLRYILETNYGFSLSYSLPLVTYGRSLPYLLFAITNVGLFSDSELIYMTDALRRVVGSTLTTGNLSRDFLNTAKAAFMYQGRDDNALSGIDYLLSTRGVKQ